MDKNFFKNLKILGLNYDADEAEILKAYHELVKIHHPDLFKNPTNKDKATRNFKIIKNAYDYLTENYIPPENREKENKSCEQKTKFRTYEEDINSELIQLLKECIENKTRVLIVYESTKSFRNITKRVIQPFGLYLGSELNKTDFDRDFTYVNNKLYLQAFCELRGQNRTFRIDRILKIEIYKEENLLNLETTKTQKPQKRQNTKPFHYSPMNIYFDDYSNDSKKSEETIQQPDSEKASEKSNFGCLLFIIITVIATILLIYKL